MEILELAEPQEGRVVVLGSDTARLDGRERDAAIRRDMQVVFQDPLASLDPRMTVYDILAEPLRTHGDAGEPGRDGWPSCSTWSAWTPPTPPATRRTSPAASGSASASPARWRWSPGCWCWTSRSPRSTCPSRRA